MIFILLAWLYVFIISLLFGYGLIIIISNLISASYAHIHPSIVVSAGLVIISSIISLLYFFIKINLLANLIILLLATTIALLFAKHFKVYLLNCIKDLKTTHFLIYPIALAGISIALYLSFIESLHYDNGLYYLQFIKWLQNYSIIPGLGNLHSRFAFNSNWHMLSALFGFPFLKDMYLNDLNGFMFVVALLYSLSGLNKLIHKNYTLSNFTKAFLIVPVYLVNKVSFTLFNESLFSAPTADFPSAILTGIVCILFVEKIEKGLHILDARTMLIFLLSLYLVTVKLSTAPILLFPVYLCLTSIVRKEYSVFVSLLFISLVVLSPWLIRNIAFSGYLVFPFPLDLFNFDWELPAGEVLWHSKAVEAWAKGYFTNLETLANDPGFGWTPDWYVHQNILNKEYLLFALASFIIYTLLYTFIITKSTNSLHSKYHSYFIVMIILASGILFWFIKAPDFRFGYGFILTFCIFSAALLIFELGEEIHLVIPYIILSVLFVTSFYLHPKTYNTYAVVRAYFFTYPSEYRKPATVVYLEKEKMKVYVPAYGEQCFDADLPCAHSLQLNLQGLEFRGKDIQDGFRAGRK